MQARFGGPQGVYATGHAKELTSAMKEFGVTSPGEALVRLLEKADGGAILRFGVESDLVAILKHPNASVACDCGAVAGGATHPRYYGSFPRVLGRYVREQQALTWEEAIRKMTGLPAATIGLVNRGLLVPGMAADIAIFDPSTIVDHATFEAPTAMPAGMRHVLVNGKLALADGAVTGEKAGAVLLRGPHEPSRPMSAAIARKVSGRTQASEVEVNLSVEQQPAQRVPRGRVRLLDRTTKTTFEMTDLGALQVTRGWAAVTGRGPDRRQRTGDDGDRGTGRSARREDIHDHHRARRGRLPTEPNRAQEQPSRVAPLKAGAHAGQLRCLRERREGRGPSARGRQGLPQGPGLVRLGRAEGSGRDRAAAGRGEVRPPRARRRGRASRAPAAEARGVRLLALPRPPRHRAQRRRADAG